MACALAPHPAPCAPVIVCLRQVRCVNTGLTARMRFKEAGLIFDKDPRQVRGGLEAWLVLPRHAPALAFPFRDCTAGPACGQDTCVELGYNRSFDVLAPVHSPPVFSWPPAHRRCAASWSRATTALSVRCCTATGTTSCTQTCPTAAR